MELGQQNQLQFSNSQSNLQVNVIVPQRQYWHSNQRQNFQVQTRTANKIYRNCGLNWPANHNKKSIPKAKKLQNHFARVCCKPKTTSTKTSQSNVNSIGENTTNNLVNAASKLIYNPECKSVCASSDDNMVASIAGNTIQNEPKTTILQIGKAKKAF